MAEGVLTRAIGAIWHDSNATNAANISDVESDDGTIIGSDAYVPSGEYTSGTGPIPNNPTARYPIGRDHTMDHSPSSEEVANGVQDDISDSPNHNLDDASATAAPVEPRQALLRRFRGCQLREHTLCLNQTGRCRKVVPSHHRLTAPAVRRIVMANNVRFQQRWELIQASLSMQPML